MPSKQVRIREYTVRAHTRAIQTRIFKFICQYCRAAVERETYATCCPKYGNQCNGIESKCLRTKQ